jgi:outer membrane protein, adhesin transport system
MKFLAVLTAVLCWAAVPAAASDASIGLDESIRRAVRTNPRVGEAAANRRAVEQEVRQVQGGLLPQIRLRAEGGYERTRRYDAIVTPEANRWRPMGGEAELVLRQLLFDGGATISEIYRQVARADSAAWRTMERAELIALDTAESYIDIVRFAESIGMAQRNVARHLELQRNVQARFSGGRAGSGDQQQVRERLEGARAVLAELQIRLADAKAAYLRSVGIAAHNLRAPRRLAGLPRSPREALDLAVAANPSLLAARSDVRAVEYQFDAARGAYLPTVAGEVRGTAGSNSSTINGRHDEASAKLVMNWQLFDGGSTVARRTEIAERVGEAQLRYSALQRITRESIDKAWGVREFSGARLTALSSQVQAADRVIRAYRSEYELGQRSLVDLLNAENSFFNAQLSLAAARGLAVFADYQLSAATGQLLRQVRAEAPAEARVTPPSERSIFPAPLNLRDPAFSVVQ